jgi:hypothetical protein
VKSFNIIKRNLFNFNKYTSSAIKRRKKKSFNDGLEDRLMLSTSAREDTKYIPNTHNNQRIKKIIYHLLTNFVQKFTFFK